MLFSIVNKSMNAKIEPILKPAKNWLFCTGTAFAKCIPSMTTQLII